MRVVKRAYHQKAWMIAFIFRDLWQRHGEEGYKFACPLSRLMGIFCTRESARAHQHLYSSKQVRWDACHLSKFSFFKKRSHGRYTLSPQLFRRIAELWPTETEAQRNKDDISDELMTYLEWFLKDRGAIMPMKLILARRAAKKEALKNVTADEV